MKTAQMIVLGCLVLLGLFAWRQSSERVAALPPVPTSIPATAPPPAPRPTPNPARADAQRVSVEAIDKFQTIGDITKWDPATGDCFVTSDFWRSMTYQQKRDFVKAASLARDAVRNLPQVRIRDANSGQQIASFGVVAGVTIQ